MTKIKCLLFLIFFTVSGFAELNLFKIKSAKLYTKNYPWLDELHLEIEGTARRGLNNALLTVSIYHEDEKVRWFDIIVRDSNLNFQGKWGPVNTGIQEIQRGIYTVKVELALEKQRTEVFKLLTKKLNDKKINHYLKKFTIGKALQRKIQQRQNQSFYLQRIKNIHGIFEEMINKRNGVFRHIMNVNQNSVSIKQWRKWFNNRFSTRIAKEKQLLEKREKQFLSLQYKTTHNNMKLYCKFLRELTVSYTKSFYSYRKNRQKKRFIPPYTTREFTTHLRYIRQLHIESQKEMGIYLEEKLGFMPPQTSSH
ncbi:hypothetical protein [Candidatus Uabimicrobium sp. HlEnr_7]|uniref:hypothetical protein n=1 Tax=Candidatus Uabimicrobium helgolandensis TaxID=3095367 RepID=UPI003557A679